MNQVGIIATQRITKTTHKMRPKEGFMSINVLKWNNSIWKNLCPYLLKTDGNEVNVNNGGIIFENYWQGSKVYETIYPIEIYTHHTKKGNSEYLLFKYVTEQSEGDPVFNDEEFNRDTYNKWKNAVWKCPNPLRYPNHKIHTKETQFSLLIDKDGNELRLDYLTARKQIYMNEYIRLIKQTTEYKLLLNYLYIGKNLLIGELDVPSNGKNSYYGQDCDEKNNCIMSLPKLELLLNDPSEAFGHGLCLAYALLKDLENNVRPSVELEVTDNDTCKALKNNGANCTNKIKENGLCGVHKNY